MKQLQVINEQVVLGKQFRIYGTFDEPLFLAKDVAEWIEYSTDKVGQMLSKIDDDEKIFSPIYYIGQVRQMWFLTEEGLYEVLMQSRKPIAKQFKKQVKAILKALRKGEVELVEQQFKLPTSYKEALQQLLQQVEENEKLLGVIDEQHDTIESLKAVGISEPYNIQSMCQHLPGKPYPNEVYNKLIELGWLSKSNVATYNITIKGRDKIYKHGKGVCFKIKGWNEFKNWYKNK